MEEKETALIGLFMLDNSLVPSDLDERYFLNEKNKIVIREIIDLTEKGEHFLLPDLSDRLHGRVSAAYVSELLGYVPHRGPKYLEADRNHFWRLLKKEWAIHEVGLMCLNPSVDIDQIKQMLNEIDTENENEDGDISNIIEVLGELYTNNGGIRTGYPTLDKVIGGLRYGELCLIGGRTTTGKTWVLLNCMRNIQSQLDKKIGFFSLEMPRPSILERLIQLNLGISRVEVEENFKSGELSIESLANTIPENIKFFSSLYSIEDLRGIIRAHKLEIIFIDYLALLKCKDNDSFYVKTTNLITDLKKLAKEEDVLIILSHQLSRKAEDGSIPVRLPMLRDSGAVEEISDFIIGIWRPEISSEKPESKDKIFLELLKNKRGETRRVECHFNRKTGKIMEIERSNTD